MITRVRSAMVILLLLLFALHANAQQTKQATLPQTGTGGRRLHSPQPVYPRLAQQARIEGTVVLDVVIDSDGSVKDIHLSSGHPMLVHAAMDAARQWKYEPFLVDGKPTEVETQITLHFSLTNASGADGAAKQTRTASLSDTSLSAAKAVRGTEPTRQQATEEGYDVTGRQSGGDNIPSNSSVTGTVKLAESKETAKRNPDDKKGPAKVGVGINPSTRVMYCESLTGLADGRGLVAAIVSEPNGHLGLAMLAVRSGALSSAQKVWEGDFTVNSSGLWISYFASPKSNVVSGVLVLTERRTQWSLKMNVPNPEGNGLVERYVSGACSTDSTLGGKLHP